MADKKVFAVYVNGINYKTTEKELEEFFSSTGKVFAFKHKNKNRHGLTLF